MPGRGEAVVYVHFPVTPAELMWPGIGRNVSRAVDDFVYNSRPDCQEDVVH